MSMAIGRVNETTLGTALRGMTRINFDDLKAEPRRFVTQKMFQLVERPAVHIPALLFSQFAGTVTNAVQFLNRNRWASGAMRESHNPLADPVIHVSLKAPLPTRQPFQNPPDRPGIPLCLFRLESRAGVAVTVTDMLDMPATKKSLLFAIGHDGDTSNAPVNADYRVVGLFNICNAVLERYAQIHLALASIQTRIAKLPVFKIRTQLRLTLERELLGAAFQRRNRQAVGRKTKVTSANTTLQHHRLPPKERGALENAFGRSSRRVFAGDHPNRTSRNLRRKLEIGTYRIVSSLCSRIALERFPLVNATSLIQLQAAVQRTIKASAVS